MKPLNFPWRRALRRGALLAGGLLAAAFLASAGAAAQGHCLPGETALLTGHVGVFDGKKRIASLSSDPDTFEVNTSVTEITGKVVLKKKSGLDYDEN